MNIMLAEWANRGLNQWTIEQRTQTLTSGTAEYNLDTDLIDVLKIIPDDSAKAEVYVSNRDIGFVSLGQESQVRVDAYPFTKFGDLDGTVTRIGADVLEPDSTNPNYRFPVSVKLKTAVLRSQGRELPLKPGMSIQANLRLREKKLISIVTDMFARNVEGLKTLRN